MRKEKVLVIFRNEYKDNPVAMRYSDALSEKYQIEFLEWADEAKTNKNGLTLSSNIPRVKLLRSFRYLSFNLQVMKFLAKNHKEYGVIHCHNIEALMPVIFLNYFKKKSNIVFHCHELPAERKAKKSILWATATKIAIKKIKLLIVPTEERKKYLIDTYNYMGANQVLLNTSKIPSLDYSKINSLKIKLGIDDKRFHIIYNGGFSKTRGIELLINYFGDQEREERLILIGNSNPFLNNLLKKVAFPNQIIKLDFVPNEEIFEYIKLAAIGYLAYENISINHKLCAPTKYYEFINLNIPMIANSNPFHDKNIRDKNIGLTFQYGDLQSFEESLEVIKERNKEFQYNTEFIKEEIDFEKEKEKLFKSYSKLLNEEL